MSLALEPVLFLDCQTTGASPEFGEVLEWGMARLWPGSDAEIYSEIAKLPDETTLPKKVSRLTGIKPELTLNAQDSALEILQRWQSIFFGKLPLIIHFARFELAFLRQYTDADAFQVVCTYEIARRLWPNLPSKSLRSVSGYLGFPIGELKRSRDHIEATIHIWRAMTKELHALGITDWASLNHWLKTTKPEKQGRKTFALPDELRLGMPQAPGVYFMLSATGTILYVGKATCLKDRVNSYFRGRKSKGSRLNELLSQVMDIRVEVSPHPTAAALRESDLIKQFDPPYNRALRSSDQELGFLSKFSLGISATEASEAFWGPLRSRRVVDYATNLVAFIRSRADLDWDIPQASFQILEEGVSFFLEGLSKKERAYFEEGDNRGLRAFLARSWRQRIIRLRERQTSTDVEDDETHDDDTEDLKDAERELSREDVANHLAGVFSHLAFQIFKGRWFVRLLNCKIRYWDHSSNLVHKIEFENGIPSFSSSALDLDWKTGFRTQSRGDLLTLFDQATYDRIAILWTELRHLVKQHTIVTLCYKQGHELSREHIMAFLFPELNLG